MGFIVEKSRINKTFLLFLCLFVWSAGFSPLYAKTTSSPNHKGWSGKYPKFVPVQWKPVVSTCDKCTKITQQYNNTVIELLNSRYLVEFYRESMKTKNAAADKRSRSSSTAEITDQEARVIASILESEEILNQSLAVRRKAVAMLERQAQYLLKAINDCERTVCPASKPSKQKAIKIAGETGDVVYQPDLKKVFAQYEIEWQGPYRTKCPPCQSIVEQLNAVPGWLARAHMQLQRAELFTGRAHQGTGTVATHTKYINSLKQLFAQLLQQMQQCKSKYCAVNNDLKISQCPQQSANQSIVVGANDDIGSSANFKEKTKKKVAGMASKALTGLLGIGGGGGRSEGPVTYKDPVKNSRKLKLANKQDKREIRLGGTFTEDGLLISTDIKKAPGKGTFHTVYLENQRGWRLQPIRLYLYEIWRDWKLSVSWTRDTYVDGELVKHEQGGWTEGWRELIAKGQETEYAQVPIWQQLGFNTAVSGARSLGTLFPMTPEMLADEAINLVIHVTQPKSDPVVTVPYVFTVSLDDKGRVEVTEVEQTHVATSSVCDTETPEDLSIAETPQTTGEPPAGSATGQPSIPEKVTPETQEIEAELDEIVVTGSRRTSSINDEPIPMDLPTGANTQTSGGATPTTVDTETTTTTSEDKYADFSTSGLGYGKITLGAELSYSIDDDPTIYGEEIDEPEIVGIVLKNFDRRWIPRHKNYTFVTAKMYVPKPGSANTWIPHDTVSRKMEITFIARSNEKGKAMNADLAEEPQDSPDLYFDPARNYGVECRDDPTGKGHFGTCKTTSEHNSYMFAINSDDYGGFSRLDVTCDGCVPLTLVTGLFPETFQRGQRWEVAVAEQDREKRAVYVPHDVNKNQISDGYLPDQSGAVSSDYDRESVPEGNGVDGDGLSAYEEYRGFISGNGIHVRTDWEKKTLMIENVHNLNTSRFGGASGLEIVELDSAGHKQRIVNFNSGHANAVDQHGLILRMMPSLNDKYAGYCFCDRERPKGATKVVVKPASRHSQTVAHELGHAVGMEHHGNASWPEKESIRAMTGGISDLFPGRVHSGSSLCGINLPAKFKVGSKGDQGSGNHQCIMKYGHYHYVYEQDGGDYDCMPATPRTIFDGSSRGTGPNRGDRTASNASNGDCLSQIWINSK